MGEKRRQHVRIGHDAQEFGVVAEFHEVVRRRRCGRGEAERDLGALGNQARAIVPVDVFEDRRLVENDAAELRQIEMVEFLLNRRIGQSLVDCRACLVASDICFRI